MSFSRRPPSPRKTGLWSVFLFTMVTVTWTTTAAQARPGLGEIEATKRFCETGPDAAVARGEALLAASVVAAANMLPNPTLSSSHNRSVTAGGDHETVIGIEIPLGIGGRRWLLQDAAAARQAQARLAISHGRVMSALSFRRSFVQASLARVRLDLLEAQQKTYRSLVDKLDKLQDGGDSARLDRDRLRVEAALSAANTAQHRRELSAQQAWLEVVVDAPVALGQHVDRLAGGAAVARAGPDKINPRVAALREAARASEIEAAAARRRWVPDIELFAGYRAVGGGEVETGHGVSLGVSLPLTFFNHGQAEAKRAEAQASIASARATRAQRLSRATTQAARTRLAAIARSSPELDKAVALAKKTERGAERLYLAGESRLLDVLQATRSRHALELAKLDLAVAEADALLSLTRARGRFAERVLDAACTGNTP
jgi:cobalt-zinc-cadmium efflux system outer membrane protein